MNIMDLVDREVIGLNGWVIGTVKNVTFDEKTWKIKSLDVQLESEVAKEFEMSKVFRSTHIPLGVTHVQGIGDKVSLKITKEDLMALVGTLETTSEAPASQ